MDEVILSPLGQRLIAFPDLSDPNQRIMHLTASVFIGSCQHCDMVTTFVVLLFHLALKNGLAVMTLEAKFMDGKAFVW